MKPSDYHKALAEIKRLQRDLDAAQAALITAGKHKSDSEETMARLQCENAALQENATYWSGKATEEAGENKPLRTKLAAAEAQLADLREYYGVAEIDAAIDGARGDKGE